ncbi:tetratricopeptide repeat protein [Aeoliella sp.]|uniref:tetratricopeptide repeat protein n=1 Tax=Aeoliella sp. TaxID=2795800 RepID=UPI003CCC37C9
MQRYRVNYGLLIGLLVGGLVAAGSVYGIWWWQMKSNASTMLSRAEAAEAKGNYAEAATEMQKYLGFKPNDDQARIKQAMLWVEVADQALENGDIRDFHQLRALISNALFKYPAETELRTAYVDLIGSDPRLEAGFASEQLQNVQALLKQNPDDVEQLLREARCHNYLKDQRRAVEVLQKLVGYSPAAAEEARWDDNALAPNNIDAYAMLARLLLQLEEKDEAMEVEQRLVAQNPDSAKAYLERGIFYTYLDEGEGSRSDYGDQAADDLKKAYELDPQDTAVLQALANQALRKEDYDTARDYLEQGLEQGTENVQFYHLLYMLERQREDNDAAMAQIERGLKTLDESQRQRLVLLIDKMDLLIDQGNITGAEEVIKDFEKQVAIKHPEVEFQKARIMAHHERWYDASRALEDIRPQTASNARLRIQTDHLLAMAHFKNGRKEKALEIFEQLLRENPDNKQVEGMIITLKQSMGLDADLPESFSGGFNERLREELDKPEEEQNWPAFSQFLATWAEENDKSELEVKLLETQVLVNRKKYDEARQMLLDIYKMADDNLKVQRAVVRLVAVDPKRGPESAMKLLDRTVEKFGDDWQLRLDRADLTLALGGDNVAEQLLVLTDGTDGWERSHQVELWKGIAARLARVGKREEAEDAWRKVAELNPDDLPSLMQVFHLALARSDDDAMKEAQKKVLELVRSKTDADWAFTEAARKFVQYRNNPDNKDLREQILKLVDTALRERPEWNEPYILRAGLNVSEKNYLEALRDYKEGFARGRGNAIALSQYVRLLVKQGSFKEAAEQLDGVNENIKVAVLGELYPEILFQVGKYRDAGDAADRLGNAAKENAKIQSWYGQFMQRLASVNSIPEDLRASSLQKAGEALTSAVEIGGDSPAVWLPHIRYLLTSSARSMSQANELEKKGGSSSEVERLKTEALEKRREAEAALREAQLVIEEDQQQLLLANCYRDMGRWFDAESIYLLAHEQNPEAENVNKQLVDFYLSPQYPLPDGLAKAQPLINDILRQYADDPDSVNKSIASWARRTAAKLLASSGDYQKLLKAEKLLASNAENNTLAVEDKLLMATFLAQRPEPVSRNKAIKLLEEVQSQQRLSPQLDLTLAQLYFKTGNWAKCEKHMVSVITRYQDSLAVRSNYINFLLERGEPRNLATAENQLDQLDRIAPTSPVTYELKSRVYTKTGDKSKARQALRKMLPTNLKNLDTNGYRMVARVATLLIDLGDTETAEKLLKLIVDRPDANLTEQLQFVQFIGIYRNADSAFGMLDKMVDNKNQLAIAKVGMNIVNKNRDEIGDKYDDKIDGWIAAAKREDPLSISVAMIEATFRDIQGRYEDAASIYRNLLKNSDLVGGQKAAVLNNLAYMIALGAAESESTNEAVNLLQQAVDILGPSSDILDTRATIWIGRGEYQAAVDDMELAVTDNPTASKYFHKSLAHMGLGQKTEALKAWEKAEDLGLSRESVGRLEAEEFDELASQIDKLRGKANQL